MKKTITESELKGHILQIYKEEQEKIVQEKWDKLNKEEKVFVVEFLRASYPEKSELLKESKWYNTLGDIAGIFDPTGIIDVVNGISYWRQGDKLFALLSFISAVPYVGDLVAKPVVGVMKSGSVASKAFKTAAVAGDAAKIAETAKVAGGPIGKMVSSAPSWGTKLINILKASIGRIPLLGRGLVKVIEEYVQIFKGAGAKMGTRATELAKLEGKTLTSIEKKRLIKQIEKDSAFRGFRDNKGLANSSFMSKVRGGVPRLFGNRATRSLMGRTKWYLRLLDFLGIANFVGPDELMQKYSDLEEKVNQFNQTPEGQKSWSDDFGGVVGGEPTPVTPVASTPSSPVAPIGGDFIGDTLKSMFGTAVKAAI
jgi:hypothetical protein